jgi:ABC-2 type transport system permease protein
MSIRSQLRYPAALILQTLGQFAITVIEFAGVWLLFQRFGNFKGWTVAEVAMLYGLADIVMAIADSLSYGFDFMGTLVRTGDFDRLLVRPLSPIIQLLGREVTIRRAGRFFQGLFIFVWGVTTVYKAGAGPASVVAGSVAGLASAVPGGFAGLASVVPGGVASLSRTIPGGVAGWLAMLAGLFGGTAIFMALFLMQAAFTFVTVEGLEAMNAFTYGGRTAIAYPLSGYRRFMRILFTGIIPLGAAVYLPVCFALGRPAFPDWPTWIGALGPLMAIPFCWLAWLLWRAGLRRYQSGGG